MKIKGIVISCLITLLSFSAVMPVFAVENSKDNTDVTKKAVTYEPRAVTVRGNITAISGTTLPLDITVALEKITPTKLKNFPGTFPIKGSLAVIHLTSDVKIVRKYLGKATVSELAAGDKVSVTGKLQADGTISAGMIKDESIQVAFSAKKGEVISWSSAGKMGFRGSKKNTPYAAQMAAEDCSKVALEAGLKKVKVYVKGPGNGRESAIRSLHNGGIEVTEIIDVTPMPHNGCRPPKRRRV